MEIDPDAYIAALQLLLSDMSSADRVALIRRAFPDLVLVVDPAQAMTVTNSIVDVNTCLKVALSIVDGSSGLGAIAAANAHGQLNRAASHLRRVMHATNIKG